MNIGILGGTFDPVHAGHLIIAEEARVKLGLNKVLFVPAGQPWLKLDRGITPMIHRVEMVRCAISTNPYFELCTLEVERPGLSYTVDTISELQKQLGNEASFFFILGCDTLADLPLWKEPNKLVQLCHFVVVPRLGSRDFEHLELSIPGLVDKVIQLDAPVIEISSSEVRQRVAKGLSIRYMVPDEVEEYIIEGKIYSESVN